MSGDDDDDDGGGGSENGFKIHRRKDATDLGTLSSQRNSWYANAYDVESDLSDDDDDDDDGGDGDGDGESDDNTGIPPEVFADIPEVAQPMPMRPSFMSKKRRLVAKSSEILSSLIVDSILDSSSSSSSSISDKEPMNILNYLIAPGRVESLIASCSSNNQLNQLLDFANLLVSKILLEKSNRINNEQKSSAK